MCILQIIAPGSLPHPCIAETGGKSAAIVSRRADPGVASLGIAQSAYGLQGQKCSTCLRNIADRPVKGRLAARSS
jgi:1-pyrroline-5-carboxylate dehydrogenase